MTVPKSDPEEVCKEPNSVATSTSGQNWLQEQRDCKVYGHSLSDTCLCCWRYHLCGKQFLCCSCAKPALVCSFKQAVLQPIQCTASPSAPAFDARSSSASRTMKSSRSSSAALPSSALPPLADEGSESDSSESESLGAVNARPSYTCWMRFARKGSAAERRRLLPPCKTRHGMGHGLVDRGQGRTNSGI